MNFYNNLAFNKKKLNQVLCKATVGNHKLDGWLLSLYETLCVAIPTRTCFFFIPVHLSSYASLQLSRRRILNLTSFYEYTSLYVGQYDLVKPVNGTKNGNVVLLWRILVAKTFTLLNFFFFFMKPVFQFLVDVFLTLCLLSWSLRSFSQDMQRWNEHIDLIFFHTLKFLICVAISQKHLS